MRYRYDYGGNRISFMHTGRLRAEDRRVQHHYRYNADNQLALEARQSNGVFIAGAVRKPVKQMEIRTPATEGWEPVQVRYLSPTQSAL